MKKIKYLQTKHNDANRHLWDIIEQKIAQNGII